MAERMKAPVLKTGVPKGAVGSNPTPSAKFAGVAQMVELLPCKQRVAGSNPVSGSIWQNILGACAKDAVS